jgi:anti-anti-sigma regulatory factor
VQVTEKDQAELVGAPAREGAVILPPILDVTMAESLQRELVLRARGSDGIVIDAAGVERISTACIQILLASSLEAASRHAGFCLRAPSAAVVTALADLGLGAQFML